MFLQSEIIILIFLLVRICETITWIHYIETLLKSEF